MDVLTGITQAGAIIRGLRGAVDALKPQAKSTAQSATAMTQADMTALRTRFLDELNMASKAFIAQRDLDGDGALNAVELGLGTETFSIFDTNGDGKVSLAEINQLGLDAASQRRIGS